MSTVTAQIEPAERLGEILLDQLTAPVKFTQAVAGARRDGVDTFVEVGPGKVLAGLIQRCDPTVRTLSVGDAKGARRSSRRSSPLSECLPRRARSRSSPAARAGSARRSAASWPRRRAVAVNYRSSADEAEAIADGDRRHRRSRGDVADAEQAQRARRAGRGGARRPRHPREQRRHHARRPHRAHERRGLARRASRRTSTARSTPAARSRAEMLKRRVGRDREHVELRRRARQPGPDELRGLEGRDHRVHEGARQGARNAAACG